MLFQFEAALSNYGLEAEETEGTVRPQVDYGVVSAKRDLSLALRALLCFDKV